MKRFLTSALFFGVILLFWQSLVSSGHWSPLILPSPADVIKYVLNGIADGDIVTGSWVTCKRLFLGYVIGCIIGLPLGLMTGRSQYLSDTLGLLALGLQTLPSVCWVPLALIWFGQSEAAMLFIVVMGTLWSVLIAVDNGVRNLQPIYVRAAKTMGSRGMHTLVKVILPASMPFIVSGMKQGWAFAWRSLMAAEIYVSVRTGFGLGHLLHFGRELNRMDTVIGVMFIIVCIGLIADKILFSPVEKFLHHRWGFKK